MLPLKDTHVSGTYGALEAAQLPGFQPPPAGPGGANSRRPYSASRAQEAPAPPSPWLVRCSVLSFAVPLIAALGVV